MPLVVDVQYAVNTVAAPTADKIEAWVTAVLRATTPEQADNAEACVRIVDETEMSTLNGQYRNKHQPTNVLSFPANLSAELDLFLLGDIVVCCAVVEHEAQQQQKLLEHHWAHMIIHGTLHLLGYDHIDDAEAERMEALEVKLLTGMNIPNPYITSVSSEDSTQNYERRSI